MVFYWKWSNSKFNQYQAIIDDNFKNNHISKIIFLYISNVLGRFLSMAGAKSWAAACCAAIPASGRLVRETPISFNTERWSIHLTLEITIITIHPVWMFRNRSSVTVTRGLTFRVIAISIWSQRSEVETTWFAARVDMSSRRHLRRCSR